MEAAIRGFHRKGQNMELYIARHGETEFNLERRIQGGGKDSPLTPKGIEQAKAMGKSLEGITFDAVYSSPLKRATDTVALAFGGKYQPILDPRLKEIGMGVIEGMRWEDALEAYPEWAAKSSPANPTPPPKGEQLQDMFDRVSGFMDDLAAAGHQKVFVLTHGYTLRVFQACAVDRTVATIQKSRDYKNCDVARYNYKDDKWEMLE